MAPVARVHGGGEKFCREILTANAAGAPKLEKIARVQSRSERPSVAWSTASGADGKSDAMRKTRRVDGLVDLVVGFLVTGRRPTAGGCSLLCLALLPLFKGFECMHPWTKWRSGGTLAMWLNARQKRYEWAVLDCRALVGTRVFFVRGRVFFVRGRVCFTRADSL